MEYSIKKLKILLENISEDTRNNLRRLSGELIQATISNIRSEMMESINEGIDNNREFKWKLEFILKNEKEKLSEKIKDSVQKTILDTQKSVENALDIMKFELFQKEMFSVPGFTANFDHTIEVDTKSGVDWTKLGISAATAAAAIVLTGGWALVLGLVGAVMGALNAIWSIFSSEYKKDQQKKNLNIKLRLLKTQLTSLIPKKMDEVADSLSKAVYSQAHPIENLHKEYYGSGQLLLGLSKKLLTISDRKTLVPAVFSA